MVVIVAAKTQWRNTAEKIVWKSWNQLVGWTVIYGVQGKMGFLSALLVVCLVAVGCAAGGRDDGKGAHQTGVTSSGVVSPGYLDQSATGMQVDHGNPWLLPLEQRPKLFDPCTEIPESALKEAGFTPQDKVEELSVMRPGSLLSCGWSNKEVLLSVASSWKSKEESDRDGFLPKVGNVDIANRKGDRVLEPGRGKNATVRTVFYTWRGSVLVNVTSNSTLWKFDGKNFTDPDVIYNKIAGKIVKFIPEGDFR